MIVKTNLKKRRSGFTASGSLHLLYWDNQENGMAVINGYYRGYEEKTGLPYKNVDDAISHLRPAFGRARFFVAKGEPRSERSAQNRFR